MRSEAFIEKFGLALTLLCLAIGVALTLLERMKQQSKQTRQRRR